MIFVFSPDWKLFIHNNGQMAGIFPFCPIVYSFVNTVSLDYFRYHPRVPYYT